jgi:adenosylcobinamide-phosphate synthase
MLTALIALAVAFALDVVVGDPPNRLHPVVAMGSLIRWMTQAFNTGTPARRFWAGVGLTLAGGALFALPWLALGSAWQGWPFWAQGILAGVLLKPAFAFRGLFKAGREVQQALRRDDLPEARRMVAWHLVSRDCSQLSAAQAASAAIESLAENLTDSFLAPLLCFALGGLPLAWFYRFVNTADAMIGYHSPEYEYFGKFAARLDDALNWIPARLAGVILVAAAALCGLQARLAWDAMLKQHGRTASPNAGWTMAAAAGALGVVLEKPGHYRLEGGCQAPVGADIGRAMQLVGAALVLSILCCGGLIVGIHRLF